MKTSESAGETLPPALPNYLARTPYKQGVGGSSPPPPIGLQSQIEETA